MAGALGLMDCSFVASINRTPITTSSSSSSSSPNANGRPQKFCTLRSSFNLRSMDSSFWNGGVGACALAVAVEDSSRQSRGGGGGAMCAQMNIFERVVRIVRASTLHLATTSSHLASCTSSSTTKLGLSEKVIIKHDINREVIMETVQQQLAKVLVGSSLLLASFGLLFMARPAFARTTLPLSTSTTSFVDENESKGILNRNVETGTREVGPSQSESAEKEKEEDPAEIVLQAFLDRYPDDLKTLEGLMYVRLRKGDVGKALEVIDKLLALKPDHAPWQLIRAQSLDFVGNSDQARQAFEAILAKDPLSARALQGLATVMLKAGEGQEMLEMLKRAVETAVETQRTKEAKNLRMLLGQMHTLQLDSSLKALRLKHMVVYAMGRPCVHSALTVLHLAFSNSKGNYEEALDQYTELLKEDPRDFRPYLCQGLVYTLMNKKVQADSAFRKYRRLCPKTFPERGYLDDLMIGAKAESRRLQDLERFKPTAKGAKEPKPLRQPYLDTAVATGAEDLQD